MAILAESLVEEWLNRGGFFTIRGVKHGVNEMDLVAIRREPNGTVRGNHVEVQVSFRPIGFICPLTPEISRLKGKKSSSAAKRTGEEVVKCAIAWVEKKYRAHGKQAARDKLWPGLDWKCTLVHGVVRDEKELEAIQSQGVTLIPFSEVLLSICHTGEHSFSASAGGDLAEIVRYYRDNFPPDKRYDA